eukprot:724275-Alexandrium_andersonii.AAC.1
MALLLRKRRKSSGRPHWKRWRLCPLEWPPRRAALALEEVDRALTRRSVGPWLRRRSRRAD